MNIRFGCRNIQFPSKEMGVVRDSSPQLNDIPAIKQRMVEDGFVLLRGLIEREKVLKARETVLRHMEAHNALTPDTPLLEGVMPIGGHSVHMTGRKGISHHPDVTAVLEEKVLFSFFERYFGEPAITFTNKWLRAVGNEKYTSAHCDFVYMGQGSSRLHSVWIPFGDVKAEQGTLAMCVGSNRLESFAKIRDTYGRMDVDRDNAEGFFSKDPMEIVEKYGGQWVTCEFQAGDVMIFGMHTMHASTTNLTNRFRLSSDVRFQPASETADFRWMGDGGGYIYDPDRASLISMEEMRAGWGI